MFIVVCLTINVGGLGAMSVWLIAVSGLMWGYCSVLYCSLHVLVLWASELLQSLTYGDSVLCAASAPGTAGAEGAANFLSFSKFNIGLVALHGKK